MGVPGGCPTSVPRWMSPSVVAGGCPPQWSPLSGRCAGRHGGCPRWMSPGCPRWMSPVDVPVDVPGGGSPHVVGCPRCGTVGVPGGCPRWMSPVDVPGGCPRWMSPVDVPGGCPPQWSPTSVVGCAGRHGGCPRWMSQGGTPGRHGGCPRAARWVSSVMSRWVSPVDVPGRHGGCPRWMSHFSAPGGCFSAPVDVPGGCPRFWLSVLRVSECSRIVFSFLVAVHAWLRGSLAVLIHGSMTSIRHPGKSLAFLVETAARPPGCG